MMLADDDNKAFSDLRKAILDIATTSANYEPHNTLMHPRNSTCTDAIFKEMQKIELHTTLYFDTIF